MLMLGSMGTASQKNEKNNFWHPCTVLFHLKSWLLQKLWPDDCCLLQSRFFFRFCNNQKSNAPYGCVVLCSIVFPCSVVWLEESWGKELVMGACTIHAAIFSGKARSDEEAVGVKKSGCWEIIKKGNTAGRQRCYKIFIWEDVRGLHL